MKNNIEVYKADLAKLVENGEKLVFSINKDCYPEEFREMVESNFRDKADDFIDGIPDFKESYQRWYSEALALLRQLLPDRVLDFCRLYEKPKVRKDISFENYKIEDCLQGLTVTRGHYAEKVVGPEAAIPLFKQQLAILQAAQGRFDSTLFDIKKMMQADLLDTEIEAAEHLVKWKFFRAAGAIAGVVLERHLGEVCSDRKILISKKNPTISDFNEALKSNDVIDVPQWRFIQHLADIRNLCDHAKIPEPTSDQVCDLIDGTKKVIKTIF